jgi:CheY-like chemotaxis protein
MNAAVNSAVSLATQSGTQFAVDALARFAAAGHGLTLPPVSQATPMVFVVDDDVSVRESLELLIRCEGWQPQTFASAKEFLDRPRSLGPCCLVLDYSLPDLNGLELQRRVTIECLDMPVIFITGHRDVPMTVQAMKAGALEFLTKPFSDDVLLSANPRRPRPQPVGFASRCGHAAAPGAARIPFLSRTPGYGVGGLWPVE